MNSSLSTEEKATLFDQLAAHSPTVVWMASPDWEEIHFASAAYEAVWGRPVEDLYADSMDFLEGVHPDDREVITDAMGRVSAGDAVEVEARINAGEDYGRWAWITAKPIIGPEGDLRGIAGFTRDITDRKRHQERLAALTEATAELVRAETLEGAAGIAVEIAEDVIDLPVAVVWRYDEERGALVPLAASDAAASISQSGTGSDAVGAIPPESPEMEVFVSGETAVFEDYTAVADRAHQDTPLGTVVFAPLDGYGMLGVGSDEIEPVAGEELPLVEILASNLAANVGRIQREEELARKNERLGEFTSMVSHDLQNPLNVAQGRLDLVREEVDDDNLDLVAAALDRMESLVAETLTLARAGERIDERETVAVGPLARSCWAQATSGDGELVVADSLTVEADPDRLRTVFENLFRNAVQHGGEDVTVTIGGLAGGHGFYVEDSGVGFGEADPDRLFDSGYTTAERGTGLGLSIVQAVVDAHGWTISAGAPADGGARFEVAGVDVH